MPRLFDDIERTRLGPARRTEPPFSYWNVSARPDVAPLRDVFEGWFSRYPAEHAVEFRRRFRSLKGHSHLSAVFELFVYELLRSRGFDIECHPRLEGTAKRPEFRLTGGLPQPVIVECVLAAPDERVTRREYLRDFALDAIDDSASETFFVAVTLHGEPTGSLPVGRTKLVAKLEAWLRTLDPDLVAEQYSKGMTLPRRSWEAGGVRFDFEATPKKQDARCRSERLVGVEIEGIARCLRTDGMIVGAIRKKATHYGALDCPYLIAINVLEFPVDGDDVDLAVEQAFGRAETPRNTRVSGLLLATIWNGLSASRNTLRFVSNPHAARAIDATCLGLPTFAGALEH